jgi:hypothetical protein
MKVFFVALSAAMALAGAALAQAPADWRGIASPEDILLIENWERQFDRAIAETARTRPDAFHRITREELADLKNGAKVDSFPARWEGLRPCRTILTQFFVTVRYDWFACRITRVGETWRIEKVTGSWYLDGQMFPDRQLGSIFLGSTWTRSEQKGHYGDGQGGDSAGLLRHADKRWLRLLFPGPSNFDFFEIDLHVRLRR